MHKNFRGLGAAIAVALAGPAAAGTDPFFIPLTQSSAVASPNHINELTQPWTAPAGMIQINLMSLGEVESTVDQSIQRVPAGNVSSMFDMLAIDPSGRYVFIPHETPFGAGVSRYDRQEKVTELLFAGDQEASVNETCNADAMEPRVPASAGCPAWDYDYGAFDPARWTPNGTVILGEEWTALGRLVEIMDPLGPAPANPVARAETLNVSYRELQSVANVAHEGVNFSLKFPNQVIYYIDEWNSGSIYALVLNTPGDYAGGGQTFVLSVDDFAATGGVASANWNEGANSSASRFGLATWKPLTDRNGTPLAGIANPFRDGPTNDPRSSSETRGGRVAADDAGATPYGRPEDMEVALLPNFNEVIYVATTSEAAVISIELLGRGKAMVRQFASRNTPKNLGLASTTGVLNSPDNLAQDALGNIYIIEDAPNRSDIGGDVWFARDTNNDGVAESLDHFLSIQVAGSEATGMIFDPAAPTKFLIAVQHPTSTDLDAVSGGMGDAVWEFDMRGAIRPPCGAETDLSTCGEADTGSAFLKLLDRQKPAKRSTKPVSPWAYFRAR